MAQAGVFACADGVLDAGLDPVGCVDVGGLAQSAPRGGGPVGGPRAVPPAVCGLEQGQPGAWMRPLAAAKTASRKAMSSADPRPGLRAAARSAR